MVIIELSISTKARSWAFIQVLASFFPVIWYKTIWFPVKPQTTSSVSFAMMLPEKLNVAKLFWGCLQDSEHS